MNSKFKKIILVYTIILSITMVTSIFTPKSKTITVKNPKKLEGETIEQVVPDANFRKCISESLKKGKEENYWNKYEWQTVTKKYTTDGNTYDLTVANLDKVALLECEDYGITNITGVEKMTNLYGIKLSNNNLPNITFKSANNPNLKQVWVGGVNLKSLNIDDELAKKIEHLTVGNNNLSMTQINEILNKYKNVIGLGIDGVNYTGELDVSNMPNLEGLWIRNNNITNIKGIETKTKLKNLYIDNNKINSLNISNSPNLINLSIQNNQIRTIDLSKNTNLRVLGASHNKLSDVDLSNNSKLTYITLNYNDIKSLDTSKMSELSELDIVDNTIEALNLPNEKNKLKKLEIWGNRLTSLDLTPYVNLEHLSIAGSRRLTSVDLTKNTKLTYLAMSNSNFGDSIDISKNTALNTLSLNYSHLKKIDISKYPNLKQIEAVSTNPSPQYIIALNQTTYNLNKILDYVPKEVTITEKKFTDPSNHIGNAEVTLNGNNITGDVGEIKGVNLQADNAKISFVPSSYSGTIKFKLRSSIIFSQLSSNKYAIDTTNNTIDVSGDTDEEIKKNLTVVPSDVKIEISGNTLILKYNNVDVKKFQLQRIINPPTGYTKIIIISLIFVVSILGYLISTKKLSKVRN